MGWDGNGNFNRLYSWVADKANGVNPSSSRFDAEDNGFASAGFGNCVTRDGQGKMGTAFLPAVDNSYDLGSGGNRWRNFLAAGYAAIGGPQQTNYQATVQAQNVAGSSNGLYVLAGTNASDICCDFVNAAGTHALGFLRGDGSGAWGYNGAASTLTVTAAGAIQGYGAIAAAPVDMTPDSSSWTTTLSGPWGAGSNPTGTLKWSKMGKLVSIWTETNINATCTGFSPIAASGVPASITPSALRRCVCVGLLIGAVNDGFGSVTVNINGTLTIYPGNTNGGANPVNLNSNANFGNSGSAGLNSGWSIFYSL